VYKVKKFEIVFSFEVKGNKICTCLHTIRLSCFTALSIRKRMST